MNCTLCKQEIELNQEATIRNDHVYHECCAITYDEGETDDGYQNNAILQVVFLMTLSPSQIRNYNLGTFLLN